MEYGKIISVTGLPGLYELLSSKNDGAIVRSLDDKSTKFVSSRIHNFSHLESIEVYTVRDNVNLVDIFKAMESSSEKLPDGKDAAVLKKYFEKVYPDLDFERVYTSDLKKMAKWLSVLQSNNVEIKLTEFPEEETAQVEEPAQEEAEAPKKKAAPKAKKEVEEVEEEAPAKKAAVKEKEKKEEPATEKKAKAPKKEEKEEKEAPKKKAATKAKKEDTEEKAAPAKKKAAPKKK